jgi:hypothetical protein
MRRARSASSGPWSAIRDAGAAEVRQVDSLERLLELQPDVVAEAAGHEALRQHGSACLSASITLVLQSVGALADPTLESALRAAAEAGDVSAQWLQEGLDAGSDRERRPGKAAPGRSCHRQTSRGFRPRGSSPERRCIEDPPGEAARGGKSRRVPVDFSTWQRRSEHRVHQRCGLTLQPEFDPPARISDYRVQRNSVGSM